MLVANTELRVRPVERLYATRSVHAELRRLCAITVHRDPANVVLALEFRVADPEVLVGWAPHTGTLVLDALLDGPLAVTAEAGGTVARGVCADLTFLELVLVVAGSVDGDDEEGCQYKEENGRSHCFMSCLLDDEYEFLWFTECYFLFFKRR